MTTRNGLEVTVRPVVLGGREKHWMWVRTKEDGSPPSFRDWFDMLQALVWCEVTKYGGDPMKPEDWVRLGGLPRDFIMACFRYGVTYEDLRNEFGLPR